MAVEKRIRLDFVFECITKEQASHIDKAKIELEKAGISFNCGDYPGKNTRCWLWDECLIGDVEVSVTHIYWDEDDVISGDHMCD